MNKELEELRNCGEPIMKDLQLASSSYTYENGKVNDSRAVRNVGKYKVFADHFHCALPYTNYYIANTETNTLYAIRECPTYIGGSLKEIISSLYKYQGIPEPGKPEPTEVKVIDVKEVIQRFKTLGLDQKTSEQMANRYIQEQRKKYKVEFKRN